MNYVGVNGAEREIWCIVIDVLQLVLYKFEEQLQFWKFPLICKGGGTIMVCSTL